MGTSENPASRGVGRTLTMACRLRRAAVIAVAALVLAACGGSDDDPAAPPPAAPPSTPQQPRTAAAAAGREHRDRPDRPVAAGPRAGRHVDGEAGRGRRHAGQWRRHLDIEPARCGGGGCRWPTVCPHGQRLGTDRCPLGLAGVAAAGGDRGERRGRGLAADRRSDRRRPGRGGSVRAAEPRQLLPRHARARGGAARRRQPARRHRQQAAVRPRGRGRSGVAHGDARAGAPARRAAGPERERGDRPRTGRGDDQPGGGGAL